MLIHLFVSVPRNDYLDEDMPDDEGIPGMPDDVKHLGHLSELSFLTDKVALFLFEFHADDYKSLG